MKLPVRVKIVGLNSRERHVYRLLRLNMGLERREANAAFIGYLIAQNEARLLHQITMVKTKGIVDIAGSTPVLEEILSVVNDTESTMFGHTNAEIVFVPDHE